MQAARCTEPPEHITAVRIVAGYVFATVNNAFHLFDRRRRSSVRSAEQRIAGEGARDETEGYRCDFPSRNAYVSIHPKNARA